MQLVSVIIPLFNKEFTIETTLKSVLEQTYTNFEIIIINDGSTDNSLEIVKKNTDKRIHIFEQENKGAASARNLGINKASSNLISFLDADDFWYPNHLTELIKLYNDFPNCGMYCNRYQTRISKKTIINNSFDYSLPDDFRGVVPDFFHASKVYKVAISSAVLIPKDVFFTISFFNPEVSSGQDLELFTKIALKREIAVTNKVTVLYRLDIPNSLAKSSISKRKLMDFTQFETEEISNKYLKIFLDRYRIEYALQYKIVGDTKSANLYLKDVANSNVSLKTKLLLKTPSYILKRLLGIKHWLRKKGINFSVYH